MNRKITAWLAIFGVALNALWPLLANAAPREFVAPICTMVGTKPISVDAAGIPIPPAPARSVASHCAFCASFGSQTPALLPAAFIVQAVSIAATSPTPEPAPCEPSSVRLLPDPRGPPASLI